MVNQSFRNRGGIPRSNISESELEQMAGQVTFDANSTPKDALARMLIGVSHHIDEMAQKNVGSPDALDENLRIYNMKAKQAVYNYKIAEQRKAEADRLARINAFAKKQAQQTSQQATTFNNSAVGIDRQPTISEHGTVSTADISEIDADVVEELKSYFDIKFSEVNNNLKSISNLLYQILANNSWQEEWQLGDEVYDETSEEITDSDEELQDLPESGQ